MAETEIELTREMYDAYINLTHPPNFNLNDTQLEDPAITKLSSAAGAYQSIIHFESLRRYFIDQLIKAQADIIPFKTADGFLPHGEVEIQNFAENKNQKWHFYLNGLPYIGFNRKKSNLNRAFTFDELSKGTTIRLIKGGLLNKWKCSINEDYINGWFDSNMDKKHIEFLNEKIQ